MIRNRGLYRYGLTASEYRWTKKRELMYLHECMRVRDEFLRCEAMYSLGDEKVEP